ncbi:MAG: single-stranded-DNA-specific exonuclease RecJ [bacterium]|nr:single-stranded-DNA-specific exonuclease RecJ [bacterium]
MLTPARWLLPQIDRQAVEALARAVPIREPAARVLWHRGYRDPDAVKRFLNPSQDELHDPRRLLGMDKAVDRLRRAIDNDEKILLYGDYDVDGVASVVILLKAIEMAGGKATFHVPDRFGEGYGMRPEIIEQAANDDVALVVSVDTGIRATEAVERASQLGIDVVITDHHLPQSTLPPAYAVINPNQPSCPYPEKGLCGAGVALKLVQALFENLGWPAAKTSRMVGSFLKMVAMATVADVVPLTGENRIIVKHGLAGFGDVRNPGLRALLEVSGFAKGDCPSAGQVAFRIAPRINAAGRMANAADVIHLFLTSDEAKARELALELHNLNHDRQQAEAGIIDEILEACTREPVEAPQAAVVFSGEGWHRGVVGIVASRLVERFHRPTFVLSVDGNEGEARGSGRSIPPFHLLEALESMSDLFIKFGGHRQAAGLTMPAERIGEFRERFQKYAAAQLTPEDFIPQQEFDARLDFTEIDDRAAADILALAPFGFGNPAPLFVIEAAEVVGDPVTFGERHLRVRCRQNGRTFTLKAWNFAARGEELATGAKLDLAIAVEDDPYSAARGYPPWSLVLRDVR